MLILNNLVFSFKKQVNIKYTIILVCSSDGFGELVATGLLCVEALFFFFFKNGAPFHEGRKTSEVSQPHQYIVQGGSRPMMWEYTGLCTMYSYIVASPQAVTESILVHLRI